MINWMHIDVGNNPGFPGQIMYTMQPCDSQLYSYVLVWTIQSFWYELYTADAFQTISDLLSLSRFACCKLPELYEGDVIPTGLIIIFITSSRSPSCTRRGQHCYVVTLLFVGAFFREPRALTELTARRDKHVFKLGIRFFQVDKRVFPKSSLQFISYSVSMTVLPV